MCTLVVCIRQHEGVPLVVAANRDEARSRPASGPVPWPGARFVAPKDEQAAGTWLGLTRSGMFVGVTNRFGAPRLEGRESRGTLVVEALGAPDAAALHASLSSLSPRRFNAFHLVYADDGGAFVTWSDGEVVRQRALAPGLHVVTERSLGGDDGARAALVRERWAQASAGGALPTAAALQALLATSRPDDPFGGVCVDVPAFDYGTRSALVLFRAARLSDSRFYWADGPPDRAPFVERGDLVRALLGGDDGPAGQLG
ncbi:MAG: NRDE family protein [Myxococcaceae bacterium]|nr:NRDE family protein [Myxococcaceae bacterium]MCA3014170.1 NRDE family protein [Myxococcaceae bacterium]